jgi:hypothetical protein
MKLKNYWGGNFNQSTPSGVSDYYLEIYSLAGI